MKKAADSEMNSESSKWLDTRLVDVAEKQELAYWARAIQISEEELVNIVKAVGPSLKAVMRAVILKDIRDRDFTPGR